jgi:hypothetical protein
MHGKCPLRSFGPGLLQEVSVCHAVGAGVERPLACRIFAAHFRSVARIFYNIELLDVSGKATSLQFNQDGAFKYKDLVLVDMEDGTGGG